MNKAAKLSRELEQVELEAGLKLIETSSDEALHFDVINNAMCVMHDDGSVNIVEPIGSVITSETISAENVLRILQHYRPFKEVFKVSVQ